MKYLPASLCALLAVICLTGLMGTTARGDGLPLALTEALDLPDQQLKGGASVTLDLPPLPAQAGQVLVLGLRAFVKSDGPGGCNWNAEVTFNDAPLSRRTGTGTERLIGRWQLLELRPGKQAFSVTNDGLLMVMFAASADQADLMTEDELGATFYFDISDLARGVDGNTVTLTSRYPLTATDERGMLMVESLRVGYLAREQLPPATTLIPPRGPVAARVQAGSLQLAQARQGGFRVQAEGGPELLVETGLGMSPDAPGSLLAQDSTPAGGSSPATAPQLQVRPLGSTGFELAAHWPNLRLRRSLEIRDGLIYWRETWTNTGPETQGIPLRHRLFIPAEEASYIIAGTPDSVAFASAAANPTIFIETAQRTGEGFGLTAESDWWRLLASLRAVGPTAEIFTTNLALAAGSSLDLEMTLTPTATGGGYWQFINRLRQRWGVNSLTMERPLFWGYTPRPDIADPVERARASLGHLGPVMVELGPWQRLEPDARVVRSGNYPKLPADAPRAPGLCPDLDVNTFLTFQHREACREDLITRVRHLRQAIPDIQLIQRTHPAMEVVYRPLQDQWPNAADAIKTASGGTFESANYTRSWVGDMLNKDWTVFYYIPRPDSVQLRDFISEAEWAMDQARLDGIYSDEFSWAFVGRGYSRYDYSRWDGYSADLDEQGQVVALKADGGMVSEASQLALLRACGERGKFFLGNGGAVLHSVQSLPHHRFVEGGNGPSHFGFAHLSAVPMLLGNMGDTRTTAGVFASVRKALQFGNLYSPVAVNLLLEGDTNFVSKLYPMTVIEIGPGFMVGRERIVTTVTRLFDWPGVSGPVNIYRYNHEGTRVDAEAEITVTEGEAVGLEVPEGGLIIAERAPLAP